MNRRTAIIATVLGWFFMAKSWVKSVTAADEIPAVAPVKPTEFIKVISWGPDYVLGGKIMREVTIRDFPAETTVEVIDYMRSMGWSLHGITRKWDPDRRYLEVAVVKLWKPRIQEPFKPSGMNEESAFHISQGE